MLRKLCILLLAALAGTAVFSQSIERKRTRLPFRHRGIARVVTYTVAHPDVPPSFDGFRMRVGKYRFREKRRSVRIICVSNVLSAFQKERKGIFERLFFLHNCIIQ